ncbi:MAG: glycosyltransferase family 4 protein [Parcubacteria group bacterium]|nr:glycosyltransferase family 4 protein [Parcubacteria group bacterium]
MKIIYICNSRIPTDKAYGVSIVKTCEALAKNGAQVLLLAPKIANPFGDDVFSYYNIQKNFSVRYVPTFDAVKWGWRYGFVINQISFGVAVFLLFFLKKRNFILLTRDEVSGFLLRLAGVQVYYDIHGFPERLVWLWKMLLRPLSGIIATNYWKVEQCNKSLGISKEKIIVARNGFDPDLFDIQNGKEELRKKINLPSDKPIVLYTGHLYDWKGVNVLLEVARNFQISLFVFVGGTPWDVEKFKRDAGGLSNVLVLGQKPYKEIPLYLKAADALVLSHSEAALKDPRFSVFARHDTSPIKMFEYMASGVPIVASDMPSVREILNEKNAVLVKSDSPEDLKRGIEKILNDKKTAEQISRQALEDAKEYTWDKRAEKIIAFINKKADD